MKLLTYKTLFLVALATARRVSGLHALSGLPSDIAFSKYDSSATLCFVPEFRAKNQPSTEISKPFVLPALRPHLCDDDSDLFLCPVRALKCYLRRTEASRVGKRRLFVSLNSNYSRDIQKGTISRWIRTLVRTAYLESRSTLPSNPIKAHEVRAVATSLALARGATLESVLKAAYWRRITTFVSFYLRDVQVTSPGRHPGLRAFGSRWSRLLAT